MYANLKEKNGKYIVIIGYKDENGKWKEKTRSTGLAVKGNKRKAELIKEEFVSEFLKNENLEEVRSEDKIQTEENKNDILFGDYLFEWLESIKSTIEIITYSGYYYNITKKIAPYFNERKIYLKTLTPKMIDEFYEEELKRVSANTVIHHHANIRKALQAAFENGLINYNYADRAHRPKMDTFIGDYYNREELKLLFQAVKGKRIEFAVIMAAYYGLRRSEILGLKWNAIDFYYDTITIKHTVSDCSIDGKYTRVAKDRTKSQKSIRTLPLVNSVKEILIKMKEVEKLNKLKYGAGYKNEYEGYVYKDDIGDLVKPGFVTQNFSQMCEKTGLKHIRFHDLRHSCATIKTRRRSYGRYTEMDGT